MGELPRDVEGIFKLLEGKISAYGHLKWNEVAMVKADMMNVRHRWFGVDVEAFRERCRSAGMTSEETAEMVDSLRRTQEGRRLVPHRRYRSFRFRPEPEDDAGLGDLSAQW